MINMILVSIIVMTSISIMIKSIHNWTREDDLEDFKEVFDARGGSYRCPPAFQQH